MDRASATGTLQKTAPCPSQNQQIACVFNVKHVLSHRILYASLYEIVLDADHIEGFMRIPLNDLDNYAFPRLHHKLESVCQNQKE